MYWYPCSGSGLLGKHDCAIRLSFAFVHICSVLYIIQTLSPRIHKDIQDILAGPKVFTLCGLCM